jgi:hypothetical protein
VGCRRDRFGRAATSQPGRGLTSGCRGERPRSPRLARARRMGNPASALPGSDKPLRRRREPSIHQALARPRLGLSAPQGRRRESAPTPSRLCWPIEPGRREPPSRTSTISHRAHARARDTVTRRAHRDEKRRSWWPRPKTIGRFPEPTGGVWWGSVASMRSRYAWPLVGSALVAVAFAAVIWLVAS